MLLVPFHVLCWAAEVAIMLWVQASCTNLITC